MRRRLRRVVESILSLLQTIVPKSDIVTVYGMPTTEGNAVEVVSALSRRYQGRIYWLVDGEPERWLVANSRTPVAFVRKNSIQSFIVYLRSEVVFFTHGLFGAVTPSARQIFVNLWHGDGVKRKPTTELSRKSLIPATYVSGGTRELTERKAFDFKMPTGSEFVFGNPRVTQFRDPVPVAFLRKIGVGERPYLIWMPTFRKSSITGLGYEDHRPAELAAKLVEAANRNGMCVIVKAHRQDAEARSIPGAISISDSMLLGDNVSLYSLIGGSAALLTDYSSVWTDYLLLDRPMGFFIPDAGTYSHNVGLYPADVLAWLPGPRLETEIEIQAFIRDIAQGADTFKDHRTTAKAKLGLAVFDFPADEILDRLASHGGFRKGHLAPDEIDIRTRPKLVLLDG